jgi:hypothetical protein
MLILAIFFLSDLSAQDYLTVLDADTVQWNYLSDILCGDCIYTTEIMVYGDTLIDDQLYHQVLLRRDMMQEFELIGFIQEDPSAGKMTLLSYSSQCKDKPCVENTIYDMTLEIGDTLEFYSEGNTQDLKITKVDTVDERRVIYFEADNLAFIEGIGATRELTLIGFQNTGLSELLCKFHNDLIHFHRKVGEYDTCYVPLTGTGIEINSRYKAIIYPNPASIKHSIELRSTFNHKVLLSIYTTTGTLLFTKEFTGSILLNPHEFTQRGGMFIYRLKELDTSNTRQGLLMIH